MNLLDKYLIEVGKHLPRKNRIDLQREIRSTLEDMLEDRSKQTGRPVDDTLIGEVLQEYGAPAKVAAAYQPTRYLIGPRLYPFFEMVVKIVFTVLTVISLIGFGVTVATSGATGAELASSTGKYFVEFLTGLISAFGNIVLVFAILERVAPVSEFETEAENWTPAELDAEPDPDQVKRHEPILTILFTMLGLAILNLYPNVVGFYIMKDNSWVNIPMLSDAFFSYLPWINLLGVLQILLALYLLRTGSWQKVPRVVNIALDCAGIVLAYAMLVGPSLITVNASEFNRIFGAESGELLKVFNHGPVIVLAILVIVQSIEVVQEGWNLVAKRPSTGKIA